MEKSRTVRKCQIIGCTQPSGFYGYCLGHEPEFVAKEFDRLVEKGIAVQQKPTCYESQRKWSEYVVAFVHSSAPDRRATVTIEHCKDCTPAYRDEQYAIGRCEHPETVFVKPDTSNGGLVGIPLKNARDSRRWEQAMMGMLGQVVSLPSTKAMEQVMQRIESSKKRVGRPKKEQNT